MEPFFREKTKQLALIVFFKAAAVLGRLFFLWTITLSAGLAEAGKYGLYFSGVQFFGFLVGAELYRFTNRIGANGNEGVYRAQTTIQLALLLPASLGCWLMIGQQVGLSFWLVVLALLSDVAITEVNRLQIVSGRPLFAALTNLSRLIFLVPIGVIALADAEFYVGVNTVAQLAVLSNCLVIVGVRVIGDASTKKLKPSFVLANFESIDVKTLAFIFLSGCISKTVFFLDKYYVAEFLDEEMLGIYTLCVSMAQAQVMIYEAGASLVLSSVLRSAADYSGVKTVLYKLNSLLWLIVFIGVLYQLAFPVLQYIFANKLHWGVYFGVGLIFFVNNVRNALGLILYWRHKDLLLFAISIVAMAIFLLGLIILERNIVTVILSLGGYVVVATAVSYIVLRREVKKCIAW